MRVGYGWVTGCFFVFMKEQPLDYPGCVLGENGNCTVLLLYGRRMVIPLTIMQHFLVVGEKRTKIPAKNEIVVKMYLVRKEKAMPAKNDPIVKKYLI